MKDLFKDIFNLKTGLAHLAGGPEAQQEAAAQSAEAQTESPEAQAALDTGSAEALANNRADEAEGFEVKGSAALSAETEAMLDELGFQSDTERIVQDASSTINRLKDAKGAELAQMETNEAKTERIGSEAAADAARLVTEALGNNSSLNDVVEGGGITGNAADILAQASGDSAPAASPSESVSDEVLASVNAAMNESAMASTNASLNDVVEGGGITGQAGDVLAQAAGEGVQKESDDELKTRGGGA